MFRDQGFSADMNSAAVKRIEVRPGIMKKLGAVVALVVHEGDTSRAQQAGRRGTVNPAVVACYPFCARSVLPAQWLIEYCTSVCVRLDPLLSGSAPSQQRCPAAQCVYIDPCLNGPFSFPVCLAGCCHPACQPV